ncbi:MAG: hypothetical protein AAGI68_11880 [Planctomycetota bacterium]
MPKVLTAAQLVALGGLPKPKELAAAKKALADGSSHQVDFVVRVSGTVTKDHGTPGNEGTEAAKVDLFQRPVIADAMRRLKITPGQLRKALKASTKFYNDGQASTPEGEKLLAVIDEESCTLAEAMPPVPWSIKAKDGAARSAACSYTVLDAKDVPACRLAA